MKIPKRLKPLLDEGMVNEVIRQLPSGKEADLYVVRCGSSIRCAKVYKEATKRSFKKAVNYQEGRKGRNSRRARAIEKRSKYGREQQEKAWHNAEVDALYRLASAGVRVPEPYGCIDGVLLMELITDADNQVAPRLGDLSLSIEQAQKDYDLVLEYIVKMLCAGLVHGDLSEFNVLVDEHGPVIIDLPQAVDAAANMHAKTMLQRDVDNMTEYYGRFVPELLGRQYGHEIWELFESGQLHPETKLTGNFEQDTHTADVDSVLEEIKAAWVQEQRRLKLAQEEAHTLD